MGPAKRVPPGAAALPRGAVTVKHRAATHEDSAGVNGNSTVACHRSPDIAGPDAITSPFATTSNRSNGDRLAAVARIVRRGEVGEAGAMERRHQKIAGAAGPVACEHAASPVRAMCCRRQTD